MRDEYYRIVIENGKIRINVFDRGNHIPTFSTTSDISNKHGREIVALFLQKYGMGMKEYKQICQRYDKMIKDDIKSFINNGILSGKDEDK